MWRGRPRAVLNPPEISARRANDSQPLPKRCIARHRQRAGAIGADSICSTLQCWPATRIRPAPRWAEFVASRSSRARHKPERSRRRRRRTCRPHRRPRRRRRWPRSIEQKKEPAGEWRRNARLVFSWRSGVAGEYARLLFLLESNLKQESQQTHLRRLAPAVELLRKLRKRCFDRLSDARAGRRVAYIFPAFMLATRFSKFVVSTLSALPFAIAASAAANASSFRPAAQR